MVMNALQLALLSPAPLEIHNSKTAVAEREGLGWEMLHPRYWVLDSYREGPEFLMPTELPAEFPENAKQSIKCYHQARKLVEAHPNDVIVTKSPGVIGNFLLAMPRILTSAKGKNLDDVKLRLATDDLGVPRGIRQIISYGGTVRNRLLDDLPRHIAELETICVQENIRFGYLTPASERPTPDPMLVFILADKTFGFSSQFANSQPISNFDELVENTYKCWCLQNRDTSVLDRFRQQLETLVT